jgi:GT2 family glycosyltransferase
MSGSFKLSVIIVNWNTRDYLASCLSSIHENLSGPDTQVVVVDNASADGSAQMVRDRFPGARLVANTENRGFAGGVNDGIAVARGEHILILNPDIILRKDVVEGLITYIDKHPDCGAVMPLLRNEDGTVQKGYVRRFPTLMQVLLFATALQPYASRRQNLVNRYLEAPSTGGDVAEVEQIPGAFLLTTREVVRTVGVFDEAYRLFFEDVDWCSRVREKGLTLMMLSCLEVIHSGGRSFVVDKGNWIQARYFVSLVTYFSRRRSKMAAVAAALIICVNALLVIARNSLLRGRGSAESRRRAALSRRTYGNVLRLFYRAFVLRRDEVPVP